jgi:hypothetical protein
LRAGGLAAVHDAKLTAAMTLALTIVFLTLDPLLLWIVDARP